MSALCHLTWLALQGSSWIAVFIGALRLCRRIQPSEYEILLRVLLPLWCIVAGSTLYFYGMEAFIAFYGANPYEGFAFVKDGKEVSQDSYFVVLSLPAAALACLLPFLLIAQRLRSNFTSALGVSLISWALLVIVPAFS